MARRVSWTNNSSGHLGTRVYRAPSPLDTNNLPAPVATVDPVAQGATAEWVDTEELAAGDYEYAVRDYDGSGEGALSAAVSYNVPADLSTAQIGDEVAGGIYAGTYTVGGTDYHIVAAASAGEVLGLRWKTSETMTIGTYDTVDGHANTQAIIADGIANHPAAEHCVNYSGGGFADWYMPAIDELTLLYSALASHPEFQSAVDAAVNNGSYMWSSSELSADDARNLSFDTGFAGNRGKLLTNQIVRPIRRVPV